MKEKLYIINRVEVEKPKVTVVGVLEKEGDNYRYTPHNLTEDTIPRVKIPVNMRRLPDNAERRLYSPNRPDIKEILQKYGMTEYDSWELLKRTKGRLMTDNMQYISKEEMEKLKEDKTIIFVGIEEGK